MIFYTVICEIILYSVILMVSNEYKMHNLIKLFHFRVNMSAIAIVFVMRLMVVQLLLEQLLLVPAQKFAFVKHGFVVQSSHKTECSHFRRVDFLTIRKVQLYFSRLPHILSDLSRTLENQIFTKICTPKVQTCLCPNYRPLPHRRGETWSIFGIKI